MRLKATPEDFVVEEKIDLNLQPSGPWAVYQIEKRGLTTLEVQRQLARLLKVSRQQVIFPALKDRQALAIQYVTVPASKAKRTLSQPGFRAQHIGYRTHPLSPQDLLGNSFTLVIRALTPEEAAYLRQRLPLLERIGLPNYFDEQRMGSYAPGWGFISKAILQRDAQEALRAYLARPFVGDPPDIRAFKKRASSLWPDWQAMLQIAPKPSNLRSVLTYLVDHPQGYRKALNLIPQRLLAIYLAAYQSYLWNRLIGYYLHRFYAEHNVPQAFLPIANEQLPFHLSLTSELVHQLAQERIPLPHHRATYTGQLKEIVSQVLAEEGLSLHEFKARILQRAYLPRGTRPLLVFPKDVALEPAAPDPLHPKHLALRVRFTLPPGSYATLVLKAATLKERDT